LQREKINSLNEKDFVTSLIVSDKVCKILIPYINLRYFEVEYSRIIIGWVVDYYKKFKKAPKDDIRSLYLTHANEIQDESLKDLVATFLHTLSEGNLNINNEDYLLDRSKDFLDGVALKHYTEDLNACLELNDVKKARKIQLEYKKVSEVETNEVSLFSKDSVKTIQEALTKVDEELMTLPENLNKVVGKLHRNDFMAILAGPKVGKCLGFGTKVLMADGNFEEIQNISVGDKVMGPDSKPRTVLSLCNGKTTMYRVRSKIKNDGTSEIDFKCNGEHILVLKNNSPDKIKPISQFNSNETLNGEYTKHCKWNFIKEKECEISVKDYLSLSNNQTEHLKLFRCEVNYPEKLHFIEPYFLGVWLGDGTSSCADITNPDIEILDYIKDYTSKIGDSYIVYQKYQTDCPTIRFSNKNIKGRKSLTRIHLESLNLLNNKHIPIEYLIDNRDNRLKLLAGIIDTDGYYNGKCYTISLMNENLSKDIYRLCRELGFRTNYDEKIKHFNGMYKENNGYAKVYTISITGRLSQIPVKVLRKKAKDSVKFSSLNNTWTFSIEELPEENYYGFVLDGDHRFLLADTTVSHNSWFMQYLAVEAVRQSLNVVFVSMEMSREEVVQRMWKMLYGSKSGIIPEGIYECAKLVDNGDGKYRSELIDIKVGGNTGRSVQYLQKQTRAENQYKGDIRIIAYPSFDATAEEITNRVEELASEGFVADVIIIDYADITKPMGGGSELRNQLDVIWKHLRWFAGKFHCLVVTASQTNRSALNSSEVNAGSIAENFKKVAHVTSMVSMEQTRVMKQNHLMRIRNVAVRNDAVEETCVFPQCLSLGQFMFGNPVLGRNFIFDNDDKEG